MKQIFLLLTVSILFITLGCSDQAKKDDSLEKFGLLLAVAPKASTAPTSLSYSTSSSNVKAARTGIGIVTGSAVIATPTISLPSGMTASYSISPSLPTGLSLNSATGVISGTPTSASSLTSYTLTVTLTAGSGFFVNGTNPLVTTLSVIVGTTTEVNNRECNFVGLAGGCPTNTPYSCTAASSCSSLSTCSNISSVCPY